MYQPIEWLWAILKGKFKRHKLLVDRIAEACHAIPAETLCNFASKRQIIQMLCNRFEVKKIQIWTNRRAFTEYSNFLSSSWRHRLNNCTVCERSAESVVSMACN